MISIARQAIGVFDVRHGVGPVCWPHFDLLWVHSGGLRLEIGRSRVPVDVRAPSGVLILPDTPFSGTAMGKTATASITHFHISDPKFDGQRDGFLRPDPVDSVNLGHMIGQSQALARRGADAGQRGRLLRAILDGFDPTLKAASVPGPVGQVWAQVEERLTATRTLADVASLAAMSESGFRAAHRREFGTSAGQHLTELRLRRAETLLTTARDSVGQVARAVGYAHAESFAAAFKSRRGLTPSDYRRNAGHFA